jgi:hypothetical protein
MMRVQGNQERMKLNGSHLLFDYIHYVNTLGGKIDTIKKDTESLLEASKKVGL